MRGALRSAAHRPCSGSPATAGRGNGASPPAPPTPLSAQPVIRDLPRIDTPTPGHLRGSICRCATRELAGADIVGINCLRRPEHTLPLIAQMSRAVAGFIACQPAAYRTAKQQPDFTSLPAFPYALDPLQLSREEMAAYAVPSQRHRREFYRCLLRGGRHPRPRNSPSAGKISPRHPGLGNLVVTNRCQPTNTIGTTHHSGKRGRP